ncbi:hypothetical protein ACWD4F_37520 [Streptomyces aureus]
MATTASAPVTASVAAVTLEVADLEAARRFYSAFGVEAYLRLRASQEHSDPDGFVWEAAAPTPS